MLAGLIGCAPFSAQLTSLYAGADQMCDDEGCVLQIYLWNGSAAWNLAFDKAVKSYKFSTRHGQHLLAVVTAGSVLRQAEQFHLPPDLYPKAAGSALREMSASD